MPEDWEQYAVKPTTSTTQSSVEDWDKYAVKKKIDTKEPKPTANNLQNGVQTQVPTNIGSQYDPNLIQGGKKAYLIGGNTAGQPTLKEQPTYKKQTEDERLAEVQMYRQFEKGFASPIDNTSHRINTKGNDELIQEAKDKGVRETKEIDDALKTTAIYKLKKQSTKMGYLDKEPTKDEIDFATQDLRDDYKKGKLQLVNIGRNENGNIKYGVARPEKFYEGIKNAFNDELSNGYTAYDINKNAIEGNNGKLIELVEKNKKEEIPETVQGGAASTFGRMIGGLPVPIAVTVISTGATGSPIPGAAILGAKQGWEGYQHSLEKLYYEGLDKGLSKEEAMDKARLGARNTVVSDVASGVATALMGGKTKGLVENVLNRAANVSAKKAFIDAGVEQLKHAAKFGLLGAATEGSRVGLENIAGYDRNFNDYAKSVFEGGKDFMLNDLAINSMMKIPQLVGSTAPKYFKGLAKEYLATQPKELIDQQLSMYGKAADEVKKGLDEYRTVRSQFEGLVPENQIPTFTNWQLKINAIKDNISKLSSENKELESRKESTPVLAKEFQSKIDKNNDIIDANNKQIETANKTLEHYKKTNSIAENDEVTGEPLNTKYEIGGNNVGEEAFRQAFANGELENQQWHVTNGDPKLLKQAVEKYNGKYDENTNSASTTTRPETQVKEEIQEPTTKGNESIGVPTTNVTTEEGSPATTEPIEATQGTAEVKVEEPNVSDVEFKNEGKADTPTEKSVQDRLLINHPFYKNVANALEKLGLIKKYNSETREGDNVGGIVQPLGENGKDGFAAGDMYFKKDGSIKFMNADGVVEFDKNGNVISAELKSSKVRTKQDVQKDIDTANATIAEYEARRDSEEFKQKDAITTDTLGRKIKTKRAKTAEELKESIDKINKAISDLKNKISEHEKELDTVPDAEATSKPTEEVKVEEPNVSSNEGGVEKTKEQVDAQGRVDEFVNGMADTNPELHKLALTDPIAALNKLIEHHKQNMQGKDANTKAYSQKAIDKFEALKKDHELANSKTEHTQGTAKDKSKGFREAALKSKEAQSGEHIGNWIIDNAETGDRIKIDEDSYYEVKKTKNKRGYIEIELQHFYKNENGEFENNPSGVKILTDKYKGTDNEKLGYRNASDLGETHYTDYDGNKHISETEYIPKETEATQPTAEEIDLRGRSSKDLMELANVAKDKMKQQEKQILGDRYDEYQKAKSYGDTEKISDIENSLTKEQQDKFFGRGEVALEPKEIRKIANQISTVEEAESINDLVDASIRHIENISTTGETTESKAVLDAVKRKALELGIDKKELTNKILSKVADKQGTTEIIEGLFGKNKPTEEVKVEEPNVQEKETFTKREQEENENIATPIVEEQKVETPKVEKSEPIADKERTIGKYEKLAMEYAKKIDKVELPSWAKIDDANTNKQGGDYDSFKKALSKSVIEMGKLLDEGVEFAKAAKEAISHLLDINPKANVKEVEDWFSKHYKENANTNIPKGITKKSLSEIEAAKTYFEAQGKQTWNGIVERALGNLAKENPNISLEEAAKNQVSKMASDIDAGKNHIATEDEIAVISYFKHTIDKSLSNLNESDPDAYNFYVKNYQADILNIAKALNKKGIGTALGMHNMVMLGMENGFKVAKMEMEAANGGKPLSGADAEFLKQQYAEAIKTQQKIHEAEKQELIEQYEAKIKAEQNKNKGKSGGKLTIEKDPKGFASSLLKAAKKVKENIEKKNNDKSQKFAADDAMRAIAEKVDKGRKDLPKIFEEAIDEFGGNDKEGLKQEVLDYLDEQGFDTKEFTGETQSSYEKRRLDSIEKQIDNILRGITTKKTVKPEDTALIKQKLKELAQIKSDFGIDNPKQMDITIPKTPLEKKIDGLEKELDNLIAGNYEKYTKESNGKIDNPVVDDLLNKIYDEKVKAGLIKSKDISPQEKLTLLAEAKVRSVQKQIDAIYDKINKGEFDKKKSVDYNDFEFNDLSNLLEQKKVALKEYEEAKKAAALNRIAKFAEESDATTITQDMVKSGAIKDFVENHLQVLPIGEALGKVTKELQKILPDVTSEKLMEAYTKQGEFKEQTKEVKNAEFKQKVADFKSLEANRKKLIELNNTRDILKKNNGNDKAEQRNNEQIQLVKNTIAKLMTSMGLKESGQGKLEKANEKQLADFHNKELARLSSKLKQDFVFITASEREFANKTIENFENNLSVEYDENSTLNQSQKIKDITANIDAELEYLNNEKVKKQLGVDAHSDIKAALNSLKVSVEEKRQQLEQDYLIGNALKATESNIKKMETDIASGVFPETVEKPKITKASLELTTLKQQEKLTQSVMSKKLHDLKIKNQHWTLTAADTIRDIYVNGLIAGLGTFEKLIPASAIKISESTIADAGFGKGIVALLNKTGYGKIVLQANKGGFSSTNKALFQGFRSAMMHTNIEKLTTKLNKQLDVVDETNNMLQKAISDRDGIKDRNSVEYVDAESKVKTLKAQLDSQYLDAVANRMYIDYIEANATTGTAKNKLLYRNTEFEKTQGDFVDEKFKATEGYILRKKSENLYNSLEQAKSEFDKKPNKENQEKIEDLNTQIYQINKEIDIQNKKSYGFREGLADFGYILGFVGRSHGALKSYSGRFHFSMSFMARMEAALKEGKELDSDTLVQIAADSYLDFERGMYQEHNRITDWGNKTVKTAIESSHLGIQFAGHILKMDVPITKVPVNMAINAIKNFTFGLPVFAYKMSKFGEVGKLRTEAKAQVAGQVIRNANGTVVKYKAGKIETAEQREQYKQLLDSKLSNMDKDYAAAMLRAGASGSAGMFILGLAIYGAALKYGGGHHKGQDNEDKKKDADELKTGEASTRFGHIPDWITPILAHQPSAFPTFVYAGAVSQYEYTMKHLSKEKQQDVYMDIATNQFVETIDQFPQMSKLFPIREMAQDVTKSMVALPGRLINSYSPLTSKEVKEQKKWQEKLDKAANSYTLDPEKIVDYRNNTPIKRDDYDKYVDLRDKVIKEKMDRFSKDGVYVIKDNNNYEKKELKELSDDELSMIISETRDFATKKVKFDLWGKDKTTKKEKTESKKRKDVRYKNDLGFSRH